MNNASLKFFGSIFIAEGNEQKKKRMKSDSDISRVSPSMRNHLDALASLKGEQVCIPFVIQCRYTIYCFTTAVKSDYFAP